MSCITSDGSPCACGPGQDADNAMREFQLLDIRWVDGAPLPASDDWGDNLLTLLTQVEQERFLLRVEQQIRKLKGEEQETAARLFVIMSGMIGLEEAVVRKLHMIDIMENAVLGAAILKGEMLEHEFGALPAWIAGQTGNWQGTPTTKRGGRRVLAESLDEVFQDTTLRAAIPPRPQSR